jgi:nicotinamide-nucleotide amidase
VSAAAETLERMIRRGLTIAVAESLTGGLLIAELIRPPGASAAVLGGVVAYSTELKHTLVGVDEALLAERGAVDAEVATQLADRVRSRLAVGGRPADIGIATTGVAGPDHQDGRPPGTVYLGLALAGRVSSRELTLTGGRDRIRAATVVAAIDWLGEALDRGLEIERE